MDWAKLIYAWHILRRDLLQRQLNWLNLKFHGD